MRSRIGVVLVVALLLAADAPDDAVKKEKEKLKGTWVAQSLVEKGKAVEKVDGITVRFDGDKIFLSEPRQKDEEGAYTIDPTKNPKELDLTTNNPNAGKITVKGIYALDGDTLKISLAHTTTLIDPNKIEREVIMGARPKDFDGKESVVVTFKREKK